MDDLLPVTTSASRSRRAVLATAGAAFAALALPSATAAPPAPRPRPATQPQGAAQREAKDRTVRQLTALEREHGARLGVFAWNTANGRTVLHRAAERFPMCSVFKTVAVAAVLRDLDKDGAFLDRTLHYTEADTGRSGYAPVTGLPENLARGMTVRALCAAAITHSDNAAANLLLAELGGPIAVTRFCRSVGDEVTRLDRWEPDLNSAEPDRITDSTTPAAIGRTYARITLTRALDAPDRNLLTGWLRANTTGDKRLRAGLPGGWTVGEKTGSGSYGTTNDVGLAWPSPGQGPVVIAVLSAKPDADAPADEPLVAGAASVVASLVT
jgi:beta-lactamase class A